jgi:hypothetical protein
MFSGAGGLFFETQNLALAGIVDLLIAAELYKFSYDISIDSKKALSWRNGELVTSAATKGKRESEFTVSSQYMDWAHLQFYLDELAAVSNNVMLPFLQTVFVPAIAPFEHTDTRLNATNAPNVKIYLNESPSVILAPGWLTRVDAIQAGDKRSFAVNAVTQKITFSDDLAGATVSYSIEREATSVESMGYETNPISFGRMSFWGIGYFANKTDEELLIGFPNLSRTSVASLKAEDGVVEYETKFEATPPSAKSKSYQIFKLSTVEWAA